MQREHDERAKLIGEQTLDLLGKVQREVEIPATDALRIDLWLERVAETQAGPLPRYLALVDRLFPVSVMIEVFSRAVGLSGLWESTRKQYSWRRQLQRVLGAGQDEDLDGEADGADGLLVPPPPLWILSAGRPEAVFSRYDLLPRTGFPRGIYDFARGHEVGLVVISELPPGRETLLLRLMGAPVVCRGALAELREIPPEDPEAARLRRLVAGLRHTLSRATTLGQEEREDYMTAAWAEFERYERETEQRGINQGLRRGIYRVLRARGIGLSPGGRSRIEACADAEMLDRWQERAAVVTSEAALFAD